MQTAIIVSAIGILAVIAYGDLRTRRIANELTVIVAILGLARMSLTGDLPAVTRTFEASAVVFTAAFLLFWRGIFGGGDAKLLAALALLIGSGDLLEFLFIMSMCGGVLALAIISLDRFRRWRWHPLWLARSPSVAQTIGSVMEPIRSTVPYGVAITAAGALTLLKSLLK